MTNGSEEEINGDAAGGSGGRFTLRPERELEANWEVDLAKKLEDYLLKICSGQVTYSDNLDNISVNFAEAALLVQGSVQVYSRKVEYLYNLVLHALEFIKRQRDQSEGTSFQTEENDSYTIDDDENDLFWGLDDIPVEAKTRLDSPNGKDTFLKHFVKPPANLVVFEGDCLDTTGNGTELESYLLATNDLYRDFILLDPNDAVAVNDFLGKGEACKGESCAHRSSTGRKSFQSPTRHSRETAHKSSLGKNKDSNLHPAPRVNCSFDVNSFNAGPDLPASDNFGDSNHEFDMDDNFSEPGDFNNSDDDDDPWKPLNPHEPGNLKVKPFRKGKAFRRNGINSAKRISVTNMFPLAKLHGTISPELTKIWERRRNTFEKQRMCQSPGLYEKLRQSLAHEGRETFDAFIHHGYNNEDKGYDSEDPDFGQPDLGMPENMYMDEDVPLQHDKHDDGSAQFETNEAFENGSQDFHANLEDLCRSHLDALLASIAETEKQTELAARVSSWKQKIEHNLKEQESHPPFDIHEYGARIIHNLSLEEESGNVTSFADVVKGQEKHEVARTFSALLQLVNNGDVELDKNSLHGDSVCYTAVNPFHIRLLSHEKTREQTKFHLSKKRVKSPSRKGSNNFGGEMSPTLNPSSVEPSQQNCKFSMKLRKLGGVRCTPEGKRRRRSRFVEPVNLRSSG